MYAKAALFTLIGISAQVCPSQTTAGEQISFTSGRAKLGAFIARPAGKGPFPAVVWNHGSGTNPNPRISPLSAFWVSHGFIYFEPHRRGYGLSAAAGQNIKEVVDRFSTAGPEMADLLVTQLLVVEVDDQIAGIEWLRKNPDVDADRIVTAGSSFGGAQALLAAERAEGIRAAVDFAGGAMNWTHNRPMRARLLEAAKNAKVPVMFVQAENDFDLGPSRELFAEMTRFGKATQIRIYPPHGRTTIEGHLFGPRTPDVWGKDVLDFIHANIGGKN